MKVISTPSGLVPPPVVSLVPVLGTKSMCTSFLDRRNQWPIKTGGGSNDEPVRAVQECSTHSLFIGTRLQEVVLVMTLIWERKSIAPSGDRASA